MVQASHPLATWQATSLLSLQQTTARSPKPSGPHLRCSLLRRTPQGTPSEAFEAAALQPSPQDGPQEELPGDFPGGSPPHDTSAAGLAAAAPGPEARRPCPPPQDSPGAVRPTGSSDAGGHTPTPQPDLGDGTRPGADESQATKQQPAAGEPITPDAGQDGAAIEVAAPSVTQHEGPTAASPVQADAASAPAAADKPASQFSDAAQQGQQHAAAAVLSQQAEGTADGASPAQAAGPAATAPAMPATAATAQAMPAPAAVPAAAQQPDAAAAGAAGGVDAEAAPAQAQQGSYTDWTAYWDDNQDPGYSLPVSTSFCCALSPPGLHHSHSVHWFLLAFVQLCIAVYIRILPD